MDSCNSQFCNLLSLREAIAAYLSRARAVRCESEQILIVNGTQQALDLIARLLVDRDDTVALEEPSYLTVRQQIFLTRGAKLLSIPVDESGLDMRSYSGKLATRTRTLHCVTLTNDIHDFLIHAGDIMNGIRNQG